MKELIIQIFGIIGKPSALAEIFGEGKSFSLDDLEEALKGIKKGQTIRVKINSGGGSVIEGFAIHDRLKEMESQGHKVITEVLGMCGSMATIIATVPSDVKNRLMHTNSEYFIHNPFFQPQGGEAMEADDLQNLANSLKENQSRMLSHYVDATGSDQDKLEGYMKEQKSLTADQAKELGFIGEVIGQDVKEQAALQKYPIFAFVDPKAKEKPEEDPKTVDGLLERFKKMTKNFEDKIAKLTDPSRKKAGTKFAEWLGGKAEDEAVQTSLVEALGQDVYDALISGDQNCPTMEQLDAIAGVTGDEVQSVMDVAMSDGCEYDAEAKVIQKLKADLAKKDKEIEALKKQVPADEPEEVKELRAEMKKMEEMIVGLKEEGGGIDDPKERNAEKTGLERIAANANAVLKK